MKKWLVTIAIIALLALAVAFVPAVKTLFFAPKDMVDAVETGVEFKQIETMILGFQKKFDRWPTEEEFQTLVNENFLKDRTDGLYRDGMVDMWGEPYNYFRQGSGFVVLSTGPDKKPGTKDDVILLRRK